MKIFSLNYANKNIAFSRRASYREEFEELQKQGKSREEICRILSLNPKQYYSAVARSKTYIPKENRADPSLITKEQIEDLIRNGKTRQEILNTLKLPQTTFYALIAKMGIADPIPRKEKYPFDKDYFVELVKQGKSRKEICEELKIPGNIYSAFVAKNGLETPQILARKRAGSITKEQIEALLAQGLSREEILEKLGLKKSTYQNLLHKLGIHTQLMEKRKQVGNITPQNLEELASHGLTNKEICQKLNISAATLDNLFKKYNIMSAQAREQERISRISDKKIKELLERGKSPAEISDIFDMHPGYVYNAMKRIGYMTERQTQKNNIKKITKEILLSHIARGYNYSKSCEILNISTPTYYSLLRKFGIEIPQTNEYKETFKKPYEKFSDEDLKSRMIELLECREINSNNELCGIIDFVSAKNRFSQQDKTEIIAFMRVLERINVGLNKAKDVLSMSEVKLLNLKKEKTEKIQPRFYAALDVLYENNLWAIADTLHEKYMPNLKEEKNLLEAEKIIEIVERAQQTKNLPSAEFRLLYFDALKSNDKILKNAQKHSLIKIGFVDEELAGKYILANKILNDEEYQQSENILPFIAIIKKSNSPSEKKLNSVIDIYDWFSSDESKKNFLNSFMEKFDISDELGKELIEEFVEKIYIQKPTKVLTKDDSGTRQVLSTLTPKAKQAIYERHVSKDNYRLLRGFESAMQKFTSTLGSNGIKEYKEGTYKTFVNRRLAELKIMGYNDRVIAFDDTFIFDLYDPKGNH